MIVSVKICPDSSTDFLKMREVDTEEEAFYEMRRYLEANNIYTDVTTIDTETDGCKLVYMSPLYDGDTICFAINYTTKPDYDSIEEAMNSDCGSFAYALAHNSKKLVREITRERDGQIYKSSIIDEYNNYIKDLKKRAGEVCH